MLGLPSWQGQGIKYVWLNVDPAAWGPPRSAEVGITADARLGLEALAAALPKREFVRGADLDKVRAWAAEQARGAEPQMSYLGALRAAIPDDGILVNELTQIGYLARSMYPVYQPGTFITPGYQGTLGYGFPTALGAAAGNPDRAVVSINGDGGFGWAMQELATLRKYDLNVAVVVFADGHFGNVRLFQNEQFGQTYGVDLRNPAFDRLAAAFDIPFARADSAGALKSVLGRAVRDRGPILIEAPVGSMPSPWGLMRLQAKPGAANTGPPNPLGGPPR